MNGNENIVGEKSILTTLYISAGDGLMDMEIGPGAGGEPKYFATAFYSYL